MAEWLASQGHEVRVITAPPYYPMWKVSSDYSGWRYTREERKGVKIYRCPLWVPSIPSGIGRVVHLTSFAISSFGVVVWLGLRWKPDVVWVVEPPFLVAPAALISGWIANCRTWLHVQDFEIDAAFDLGILGLPQLRRFVNLAEAWIMKFFDNVSTISDPMVQRLLNKGLKARKCVYFPNWIATDLIYPLDEPNSMRREFDIPEEHTVALYSGNMGEKQGLEIVLDAARQLVHKKQHRFVLCGDGAARSKIQYLASGLPNVQFLPLQPPERLNQLLNLADLHLLPHQGRAADLVLPSKLIGMLASGRPVIAVTPSDTEVARIVKDCGIVVAPNDVPALSQAIEHLIENKGERTQLGGAGRIYAMQHWEKENVLKQFQTALCRST